MISIPTILAFIYKYGSPMLDFLKKHWRITLEVAGAVWIIVCCLTHCGSSPSIVVREQLQPISVIAPRIPEPVIIQRYVTPNWDIASRPVPSQPMIASTDSIRYLLELTDWFQNQLYDCDSTYREDTAEREYADSFDTDSIKVDYSIVVSGRLKEAPRFSFTPKWKQPTELVKPRGIYLEGSIGPVMSYGDPIKLLAIRGEFGIGVFNRKGWSYGIKGGASQIGWDVQASVRRNFSIGLSTKSR